jgi:hypothetical protein
MLPIWDDKDGWHAATKNLYREDETGEAIYDDQMGNTHVFCLIYPALTKELTEWLDPLECEYRHTVMGSLVSVEVTVEEMMLTFEHNGEVRKYVTGLQPMTLKEDK